MVPENRAENGAENRAENGPENEPEIGLEVKKHFFSLESYFLFSLVNNTFRSSKL